MFKNSILKEIGFHLIKNGVDNVAKRILVNNKTITEFAFRNM